MEKTKAENQIIEEMKSNLNTFKKAPLKTAVIAAAGLSKRFHEKNFCKSLIKVHGLSIISRHIFNLIKIGIKEIIVILNNEITGLKDELENGNKYGINISYQIEEKILGTGGSLKKLNLNETFFYVAADSIIDMNYSNLFDNYESDSLLLFKESEKNKYSYMGNKSFVKYIENKKGYTFAGIGILNGRIIKNYFPKENIFDIHVIFEGLEKEKKLKGILTNKPIFNINDYNRLCESEYYFFLKEKFINSFCIEHKINTIIFDLDFTLFDSSDIVVEGINYSLKKLNSSTFTREKIQELTNFNFPRGQVYNFGKKIFENDNKADKFVEYYYEYIKDKYPKLYPGSNELLYFLKAQKMKLGIFTSKSRSICINTLKYLEIYELFDTIICNDDINIGKPNEEGLQKLMISLKIRSENAIYIGDSLLDAIPSKKLNIYFFGVLTGFHSKEDFNKINEYFIFNNIGEILNYFRQLFLLSIYTKRYPNGVKEMILTSEMINENTKSLSILVDKNPLEAMKLLLKADIDSLESIKNINKNIEKFRKEIKKIVDSGNKIHFFGCGSSGRLLILVGRIMKKLNYSTHSFTFNISGGDTTVPKSFADFEDNINYGVRQLKQINYNKNDLVITVSGSGTAPFLLEILYYVCINSEVKPYSIFCNEYNELEKRCKEHKLFNLENIEHRVNWFSIPSGPMSITGSTRLQATLVMTIVVQCICIDLDYISVLNNIISILKNINLQGLLDLANKEYEIYQKGEKIVYDTSENCSFITMMDTTERTATFNLSPFKNDTDIEGNYSLCYLHIKDSKDTYDAMSKLFLKKPYLLNWKDYPKTNEEYFYGFNFSKYDKSIYQNLMEIDYNNNILSFKNENLIYTVNIPEGTHELVFQMVFKTLINIYSNIVMGLMKLYKYNIMTNVTACNTKLIGRICYFVEKFSSLEYKNVLNIVLNSVIDLRPSESIIENCLNFIKVKEIDNKIKNVSTSIITIINILENNFYFLKSIEKIENGASDKVFIIKNMNNEKFILVSLNEEEKTDFLKVNEILKAYNIKTPKIYNIFKNIIIEEDLGNILLTNLLLVDNFDYDDKILDLIINIQKIDKNDNIDEYNKDKIFSEIYGFYEKFILEFMKIRLSEDNTLQLKNLFNFLVQYLHKLPKKYFLHKDLNSSNIILKDKNLYLIDFQSSKFGSRFYDLISYLTDERLPFNLERMKINIEKFLNKNSLQSSLEIQKEILFNILHRHIKNLGTFSNLIMKGKKNYIYCICNSFSILLNVLKDTNKKETKILLEIMNNIHQRFINNIISLNQKVIDEFEIDDKEIIIITGPANCGKTFLSNNLSKKYNAKNINFDELLINNIYNNIISQINKDDKFENDLIKLLGKKLVYYVKHHNFIENDPFILKFIEDYQISSEILRQKLDYLFQYIPNSEENKNHCFDKLMDIIDSINSGNIIIDFAYLSKDDYIKIFKKNNNLKVIFCYLPFKDILNVIHKRNIKALLNDNPFEYRHPIHTITHYFNYGGNDNNAIYLDEITLKDIDDFIKNIEIIDPYYKFYHRQNSTNPNILKDNFNYPVFINMPNYPNIFYLNKKLQNSIN